MGVLYPTIWSFLVAAILRFCIIITSLCVFRVDIFCVLFFWLSCFSFFLLILTIFLFFETINYIISLLPFPSSNSSHITWFALSQIHVMGIYSLVPKCSQTCGCMYKHTHTFLNIHSKHLSLKTLISLVLTPLTLTSLCSR